MIARVSRTGSPGRGAVRRALALLLTTAAIGEFAFAPLSLAAQWVEAPGHGWVSVTAYHQDTRERFGTDGEEQPFFAEGHAVATSLYISSAVGLLPWLDVWAEVPFHRLRFDDVVDERTSTGLGDPRVWLRIAPLRLLGSTFPLAVRGGVKLAAGDFPIDAEVIPLGEGQRDWEVVLEVGHSFYPAPHYVMAWLGHRWREEDEETRRDWGDEVFFLAQVGGSFGTIGYKLLAEGWKGDTPVIEGLPVPSASREFAQLTPALTYPMGPGQLEAGVRLPLGGHNLPAGHAWVLGYFFTWGR